MPLTTLDSRTALLVIDLQKGVVRLPCVHSMDDVVRHASELATAFREQHLPVVLVNANGGAPGRTEQSRKLDDLPPDWTELVPELDQQPDDLTVTKRTWGAFMHTDLHQQLQQRDVTQVVIAGVATSIGVESTARQAYELGFNVTLAVDAMTDMSAEAHENSVTRMFPRMGETGCASDVIALLKKNLAQQELV